MKFGTGNTNTVYKLVGNTLCESVCEKDLGVYVAVKADNSDFSGKN